MVKPAGGGYLVNLFQSQWRQTKAKCTQKILQHCNRESRRKEDADTQERSCKFQTGFVIPQLKSFETDKQEEKQNKKVRVMRDTHLH